MKQKRTMVFLILLLLMFNGCSNSKVASEPEDEDTTMLRSQTEIEIYSIDYTNLECLPSICIIPENTSVNAEFIVNEVIANFKERVKILDIESEENRIVVNFSSVYAPLTKVSDTMEAVMLDCIAYSLLDNLDYCSEIYFRSDDGPYKSPYIELEYNEPYISN